MFYELFGYLPYCNDNYSIDWNSIILSSAGAFIGTGFGAYIAFCLQNKNEREKNISKVKNYEIEQLTLYFYNLHFAIRNISIFIANVNLIKTWKQDPNVEEDVKSKNIPTENINFDFNEEKLSFVCKNSSIFYESIIQLKTDLKIFYDIALQYNNGHNYQLINSFIIDFLYLSAKLSCMIKNLDKYIIKYYGKETLIVNNIADNINKLDDNFQQQVKIIKNECTNDCTDVNTLHRIEELEKIKDGWNIEF